METIKIGNAFVAERYIDEGHKHFTGPVIDGRALYKRLLIRRRKDGRFSGDR